VSWPFHRIDRTVSFPHLVVAVVMEQRGRPDLPISHWGGELDIDDPKFPINSRNSHNHYTTAQMVTNLCFHESASPKRLAPADAMRT
jgi:hypothetical protein